MEGCRGESWRSGSIRGAGWWEGDQHDRGELLLERRAWWEAGGEGWGEVARSRRYDVTRVIANLRAAGGGETEGRERRREWGRAARWWGASARARWWGGW